MQPADGPGNPLSSGDVIIDIPPVVPGIPPPRLQKGRPPGFVLAGLLVVLWVAGWPGRGLGQALDPSSPQDIMREFSILAERLRRSPHDVGTLNSLGILYARAGRLNDAILLWNRGLAINPRYIHLYNNLGSALKAQGRLEEAIRVYQAGLSIAPSFWIHYNLGLLEKDRGRYIEAARCFQACLRQNPSFEPAAQKLQDLGYVLPSTGSDAAAYAYKPPISLEGLPLSPMDQAVGPQPSGGGATGAPGDTGRPWRSGADRDLPVTLTVEACTAYLEKVAHGAPNRMVALTFDDGPHAEYTPRLLDLLQSHGARATFFVLGSRAEVYPDLLARMAEAGHEVGNHTWNHKSLAKRGSGAALADLQRTAELIAALTNQSCRLVRPPYGHTNAEVRAMIHRQGWHHIMWDADSRDWQLSDPNAMLARVLRKTSPGAVVLFHDIHSGALRVLPVLLPALQKAGYHCVTVSQLLRDREPKS
ncbi:MAG: polysaccharide deacetylase family protein [Candidatus Riflebacteria bacterium]|nr:polysaccharide deacetylase family protein [Candidatus Riflebacteria bacterium]